MADAKVQGRRGESGNESFARAGRGAARAEAPEAGDPSGASYDPSPLPAASRPLPGGVRAERVESGGAGALGGAWEFVAIEDPPQGDAIDDLGRSPSGDGPRHSAGTKGKPLASLRRGLLNVAASAGTPRDLSEPTRAAAARSEATRAAATLFAPTRAAAAFSAPMPSSASPGSPRAAPLSALVPLLFEGDQLPLRAALLDPPAVLLQALLHGPTLLSRGATETAEALRRACRRGDGGARARSTARVVARGAVVVASAVGAAAAPLAPLAVAVAAVLRVCAASTFATALSALRALLRVLSDAVLAALRALRGALFATASSAAAALAALAPVLRSTQALVDRLPSAARTPLARIRLMMARGTLPLIRRNCELFPLPVHLLLGSSFPTRLPRSVRAALACAYALMCLQVLVLARICLIVATSRGNAFQ